MAIRLLPYRKSLYGFSGRLQPGKAMESASPLMDRMWKTLKSKQIPNAGINHWYYGPNYELFVGVEIAMEQAFTADLEMKEILFNQYAYWKHVGSFQEIHQGYRLLHEEIQETGYTEGNSSLEIYGHQMEDNVGSEMEILIEIVPI